MKNPPKPFLIGSIVLVSFRVVISTTIRIIQLVFCSDVLGRTAAHCYVDSGELDKIVGNEMAATLTVEVNSPKGLTNNVEVEEVEYSAGTEQGRSECW